VHISVAVDPVTTQLWHTGLLHASLHVIKFNTCQLNGDELPHDKPQFMHKSSTSIAITSSNPIHSRKQF